MLTDDDPIKHHRNTQITKLSLPDNIKLVLENCKLLLLTIKINKIKLTFK